MDMPGNTELPGPSLQNGEAGNKLTCHLVKLPRIILTRIDEGNLHIKKNITSLKKTQIKRLGTQNTSKKVNSKRGFPQVALIKKESVPKGQPKKKNKKQELMSIKLHNLKTKTLLNKETPIIKTVRPGLKGETKALLKKTMLQKRSKVVIPVSKKPKLTSEKSKKSAPLKSKNNSASKKQITPKSQSTQKNTTTSNKKVNRPGPTKTESLVDIKIEKPLPGRLDSDSSEDEFLYDALMEELENVPMKKSAYQSFTEKTTNITLKPNAGNKPPTVVKGGIVKKTNLPADLQPIASPNIISSKDLNGSFNLTSGEGKTLLGNNKRQHSPGSTVPTKIASPWPVSPLSKKESKSAQKKRKSTIPKPTKNNMSKTPKSSKVQQLKSKNLSKPEPIVKAVNEEVTKPTFNNMSKPKFGPKQTAKVTPLSKSANDDEVSDEYTEEETLENLDYEPVEDLSKSDDQSVVNKTDKMDVNTPSKKDLAPDLTKNDADPNLDLLRILTDDTDDITITKPYESDEKDEQENVISILHNNEEETTPEPMETSHSNEVEEEPPVRTIYDLMSEVSLQYPSWNLHIIPETNAFCIAQVTKGRLGLPTLKKCIELDPVDYNAKVYIHQYHIKRFDGVYDSEESIIALIQEINSIKA